MKNNSKKNFWKHRIHERDGKTSTNQSDIIFQYTQSVYKTVLVSDQIEKEWTTFGFM